MQGTRRGILAALCAAAAGAAVAPAEAAEQQAYAAGLVFATPVVVASQGDTLRFNNADPIAGHNLLSDTPGLFGSDTITQGESAPVAGVDELAPGTYQFHCSLHSWMKGALQITSGPAVPSPPTAPGPPDPNDPPNPVDLLPHAGPAALAGGDWPFYGKDLANSRDGGGAGPSVTDVPFLRPVWSVKSANGDFTGTPVVSGGILVAASGGGSVIAVDASTGRSRWSTDVTGQPAESINGTAAIADGRVFVPISRKDGPEVAALSLADGSLLWKVTYDGPLAGLDGKAGPDQSGADTFGSPVVWEGKVFIGTSGQNGDPVQPVRGAVTALDAATGAEVWKSFTVPPGANGGPVWSTPAIDTSTGILYAGTGNAYSGAAADTTDAVVAIDARTGVQLRHFQATPNDVFTASGSGATTGPDYDFGASPQLMVGPSGQKLVGEGQKSGVYWAFDRATLAPVWSVQTGPGSPLGGVIGSTAYDGKRIYGPDTLGGEDWALNLDGSAAWISADGGPLHWSSTAVANGVVYTADMSSVLTAREANTGAVLAKVPLGAPTYAGVAVAGGYVFALTGAQGASGYIVGYRADPPGVPTPAQRRRASGT